jgi:hypothetical protein
MYKIIYILLFLIGSVVWANSKINTKIEEIYSGSYHKSNKILKVNYYNTANKDNIYTTFIKTDDNGNWKLLQKDLELKKLQDGDIVFEIYQHDNNSFVTKFDKSLDKGLKLKIDLYISPYEVNDEYINKEEVETLYIRLQSEANLKQLEITLTDKNSTTKTFTLADFDSKTDGYTKKFSLADFAEGKIVLSAKGVDELSNETNIKKVYIKDTVATLPVITAKIKNNNLMNVVNKKIIVAKGKAEPFGTLYFRFKQNEIVVDEVIQADKNGDWELVGGDLDVSVFENGDVEVTLYQVDLAKNKSRVIRYINKKFKRPIFPLTPIHIDAKKYQLIYTLKGHDDYVTAVTIGKDYFYTASYGVVKVWTKSYAKLQKTIEFPNKIINSMLLDKDKLFVALNNGDVAVIDRYMFYKIQTIKLIKFRF